MYNAICNLENLKYKKISEKEMLIILEKYKNTYIQINNKDLNNFIIHFTNIPKSGIFIKEENIVLLEFEEELLNKYLIEEFRIRRNQECFPIINRGKLWYDNLTNSQLEELNIWYNEWLNVTETLIDPIKPIWIK